MFISKSVNGAITYPDRLNYTNYLFRVSQKAIIFNEKGQVLVVKETGRDWWDIPGGGIDHGESIKDALARELKEEVSLKGDFKYEAIIVEDPRYQEKANLYQMRIIYLVTPDNLNFEPGEDGDEIVFINPLDFKDSKIITEQKIYEYSQLADKHYKLIRDYF
ncbi:MAG: NUDIX hydrolase [Candidatus Saccharibacteria bacterium]